MSLPSPYDYSDWREYADALISALGSGFAEVGAAGTSITSGTTSGGDIAPPPGYFPVFWDTANNGLFLASSFTIPPPVFSPFQIDTQSLALASVDLNILADSAVTSAKLADLAVITAKVADATILSAKIGDLQVIAAKIADLSVNTAKIVDASIITAKIGDLQVTAAKIGLAQIGTAQIANAAITNALMANASIGSAQIIDASILTADIGLAQIATALIQNGAIVNALIGSAAIGTANIQSAAITTALIGLAQITTALIADASITSAKITDLVVDKITAGTLDATIDVGTGILRFTIGGFRLSIGRGFGTTSQFIMWFGPSMAESAMTEGTGVFFIKTNGDAYFGGTLSAGLLKNGAVSTSISHTAAIETGTFGSNGNPRNYIASIDYHWEGIAGTSGSFTTTPSYVLYIEKWNGSAWVTLTSGTVNGTVNPDSEIAGELTFFDIEGSITFTDSSGGLTVQNLRARVDTYTFPTWSGGGGFSSVVETQRLAILSTEG